MVHLSSVVCQPSGRLLMVGISLTNKREEEWKSSITRVTTLHAALS
jgi:hypothetical protein